MESLEGIPTKEQVFHHLIPASGIGCMFSVFENAQYSFLGAGEPIGENSLCK